MKIKINPVLWLPIVFLVITLIVNPAIPVSAGTGIWIGDWKTGTGHWEGTITFGFDNSGSKSWTEAEKNVVREAVKEWQALDPSIRFKEVNGAANLDLKWGELGGDVAGQTTLAGGTPAQPTPPNAPPNGITFNTKPDDPIFVDDNPSTDKPIPDGEWDLLSVAKHELGHCLGLHHSFGTAEVMDTWGPGQRQHLTDHDKAAILRLVELGQSQWFLQMFVESDPAGHGPFVVMPAMIGVNVDFGDITFSGPPPWVTVNGDLNADGTFTAVGTGDVAGRHVIGVQFEGKITSSGLSGRYSMGVKVVTQSGGKQVIGGLLPTGQPIIFHVEGHQGETSSAPAPTIPSNVTCAGELPKAIEGFTLSQTLTDPAKIFGQDTAKVQAFGLRQVQVNSFTATDPNSPIDNASLSSTCFNTAAGATQFNGYLLAFHQVLWQQVNPLPPGVFDFRVVGEQGVANGIQVGSYRTVLNNVVRNLVVNAKSGKTPSPSDLAKLVNLLLP